MEHGTVEDAKQAFLTHARFVGPLLTNRVCIELEPHLIVSLSENSLLVSDVVIDGESDPFRIDLEVMVPLPATYYRHREIMRNSTMSYENELTNDAQGFRIAVCAGTHKVAYIEPHPRLECLRYRFEL